MTPEEKVKRYDRIVQVVISCLKEAEETYGDSSDVDYFDIGEEVVEIVERDQI